MTSLKITPIEYGGLQAAYDHFNAALFDGALVDVMIVYQRRAHSAGHFAPDRYSERAEHHRRQHELSLNPDGFYGQSDIECCQTLVHEMAHVWQHQHGKPSRAGYHNREWAQKMKTIGLYPSNTGRPGGKETGVRMSDYIIASGRFAEAFTALALSGWKLNLQSAARPADAGSGPSSKTKFSCPKCRANAWGKPDLVIACIPCKSPMPPATMLALEDHRQPPHAIAQHVN